MKIWKLIAGILSFIFVSIVIFQSCAAGLVNAIESNGESSGSAGVLIAILMLVGGVVSIATRNAMGHGGNIALIIIHSLAYLFGTILAGNFSDLRIWAWWCLFNALVATSAIIYDTMTESRMANAIAMAKIQERSMPGANVPNWYYQYNNQWYGPFTRQQIPALCQGGYLTLNTPVYYEGAQQATYASYSAIRSYIPSAVIPENSSTPGLVSILVSVAIGILCIFISVAAAKSQENKEESTLNKKQSANLTTDQSTDGAEYYEGDSLSEAENYDDGIRRVAIGEEFGNKTITGVVLSADLDYKDYNDLLISVDADHRAIYVKIQVTNTSDSTNYVSVGDFSCYADDVSVTAELFDSGDNDYNANIDPGRSAILGAVYVVPVNTSRIEMEYRPIGESADRQIIIIQDGEPTNSWQSSNEDSNTDHNSENDEITTERENDDSLESDEPQYEQTDIQFNVYQETYGDGYRYDGLVEITNTGNKPIYFKNIGFDIEDEEGHLLQTDDLISDCPDLVMPGEKGYLYAYGNSLDVTDPTRTRMVPHCKVKTTNKEPIEYDLSDVSLKDDTFGVTTVGRVSNNSNEDDSMVYIQVVYYDAAGKCIGISGTNVLDLSVGRTASFEISSIGGNSELKVSDVADYRVIAQKAFYDALFD